MSYRKVGYMEQIWYIIKALWKRKVNSHGS